MSSAGFASSTVLFNLPNPPFVRDVYTVGPFQVRDFSRRLALCSDKAPIDLDADEYCYKWYCFGKYYGC
jgi:hypothetical protein